MKKNNDDKLLKRKRRNEPQDLDNKNGQEEPRVIKNECYYPNNQDERELEIQKREKAIEEIEKQLEKEKRKNTGLNRKIKIGILIILIIILLMLMKSCADGNRIVVTEEGPTIIDITLDDEQIKEEERDKETPEERQARLNELAKAAMITISMNTAPLFLTGESEGNLNIYNSSENLYWIQVEIYRDDTNEMIYQSNAIDIGNILENDKLDVAVPTGEYKCTAYFKAIDKDTKALIGKAGANIILTVLANPDDKIEERNGQLFINNELIADVPAAKVSIDALNKPSQTHKMNTEEEQELVDKIESNSLE